MDQPTREYVEREVARHTRAARPHWVRFVIWTARLYDDGAATDGFMSVNRVLTWDGTRLGADYSTSPATTGALSPSELDDLVAGTAQEGWTVLRVETDRDGALRVEFGHETPREVEDSASDPFWADVHDYLERNRPSLDALVERLGREGTLPDPALAPTGPDPMSLPPSQRPRTTGTPVRETRSRLGRFFGRG